MAEPELDEDISREMVRTLERCTVFCSAAPIRVWRELLNGRWVVFLSYGQQTYSLLPLSYSTSARIGRRDAPRRG